MDGWFGMNCIDGKLKTLVVVLLLSVTTMCACAQKPATNETPSIHPSRRVQVVEPVFLDFTGPLNDPQAEVSGLTWKNDLLAILPQDPILFGRDDNLGFFTISREQIEAKVAGLRTEPLTPEIIGCEAVGMMRVIAGFDGLEAVATMGDRIYLTIEAKEDTVMAGYLLCGHTNKMDGQVVIDMTRMTSIPLGCNIPNVAEESIVIDGERVITMSEANGRNVMPNPKAKVFDQAINYLGSISFPTIEYRVTDATALDEDNRFWVINYFYPGEREKLKPAPDAELEKFGYPEGYDPDGCVERLLELQITEDRGIVRTETPPINLKLMPELKCRNWEALVRMDDHGFLLMTDKYPGTLLAYVPNPFVKSKEK